MKMIKTKQELLNHFSDINEMYNNPFMYQTLSNMIDELLEQQPCEDCKVKKEAYIQGYDYGVKDWFKSKSQPCEDAISREDALKAIEEQKKGFYGVERYAIDECHSAVMKLPSVRPCREIVEDKRACEKCIHYVTRDSRGVVLCGCDSWECDFKEVKT
jgi:hypothetical protein